MAADTPGISVVVIGRNEGERLVRCLRSVRASRYPAENLELIYVDSGSGDGSPDRAAELGAAVLVIQPERPCAAAARNAGFRTARHELVHFLDGDTTVDPDWFLKAVWAISSSPDIACVFGRRSEVAPNATLYNFWAHHDWYVAPGPARSCAGDALFRREVLARMSGFDPSLIAGEEPDLCFRIRDELGMTILSLDEPMTLHDMNMTRFGQYWRRSTRTGHAYAEVGGRYRRFHSWRQARWRSVIHVGAFVLAVLMASLFRSGWPVCIWAVLLLAAISRNALRCRGRVGSLSGAWLYSAHHYLAKLPIVVGQCQYWVRRFARRPPQSLIEYRGA